MDNVFGFLGYHFAGKLTNKFGAFKTLFGQQIIGRLNILVAAGLPTIVSPFLLNINAFFFGVGETANRTLMHKEFSDKQRATMGSLNSLAGSLFYAVLIFAVGLVADTLGPAKTILLLGVLSISVVLLYRNLYKN